MPLVSPSHVGTECKDTVCRDGRAGGQGHWVHLSQRHQGSHGLSLSLPGRYPQSWSQRVRPRSCFSPEKGGDLCPLPAFGRLLPQLPKRHLLRPSPLPSHLANRAGPSAGPLKRQLCHVSSQRIHPEHRNAEAAVYKPGEGAGLYP